MTKFVKFATRIGAPKLLHDFPDILSGAADRFVKIVDIPSKKLFLTLEGHTHHVVSVSFKADGRTLASAAEDNQIKMWDLVAGEKKGNIPPAPAPCASIKFLGITDHALLTSTDGQIRILNEAGGQIKTLANPPDYIQSAALSPDAKTLLCASQSGALYIWDIPTAKLLATLPPPPR